MTTREKQAAISTKNPATQTAAMVDARAQLDACRQYCQANGLSVADEYAADAGKREQFQRMTTAVATEGLNIDAIVVWKLNRFSMSLEETIEWRDKLRTKGVQLLSVTERGPGE